MDERPSTRAFETAETVRDWRCQIEDPDGGRRSLTVSAAPLEGEDGEVERVVVAGEDITQLQEQARQLGRQRDDLKSELEAIFERIDDGFFALDENLSFVHLNDQAAKAFGGAAREFIGEHVWNALEPGPKAEAAFEEALETGESVTFEEYYEPREAWFETHVYPSETGLSVYFQDVTERKYRRQELERYRTIVETMSEGVYVVDDDGYITLVNDQYAAMVDRSKDDLQGAHVSAVIDDESTLEQASRLEAELVDGERDSATLEAELQRSDGEPWIGEATFTVTATDGGHERVGVVRDVTERKEREQELKLYERIVSTMEDGVYVLDDDFDFVKVNDAYLEMTGYSREELLGTHCSLVVSDEVTAESARQLEEMLKGAAGAGVIEADMHRADGSTLRAESRFTSIGGSDGQSTRKIGVVRDVSERVDRERELEEYRRWTQTLLENFPAGAVALVDEDLRYISFGGEIEEETRLTRDDLAGECVQEVLPTQIADVVVPAYEDALDGTPSEFKETIDDRIYQFHFVPVRDDEGEVFAATAMSHEVTQRVEQKRELERQREELAALNNLNNIVREITDAVIDQSTREEIEETVCERLAESESYKFAWIAEVDPQTLTLDPHVEAGVDGYLDTVPTSIDPDEPSGQGPGGRAIRTLEIQTTQDAMTDPDFEPWREHAKTYGYRSAAGIPIIHDGTLYGLLGVYADRPKAFESQEKEVIGQLGEIVGHAIAAAERKQALMSDELVELDFHMAGIIDELGVSMPLDERITLDHAVPRRGDGFLVYGTATPGAVETVRDIVDVLDYWESVEFRDGGDPLRFELQMSDPPVLSTVASLGGYVEDAVLVDGDFDLRIHLAPSVDVRRVIDAVETAYSSADMRRRRQITRAAADPHRMQRELLADLTEKQRATIETAYHAGFFAWPRDASGKELADSLGVAAPTFHQHLRKAEAKVFDSLLSAETSS
jgi:PAS domain S-box-containing protein